MVFKEQAFSLEFIEEKPSSEKPMNMVVSALGIEQKMEAMNKNEGEEKEESYCLCNLPDDLLRIILSYLSVLDYINFRAVCKCWRLAFSKFAAVLSQEKPGRELPCFLVLKREHSVDKSIMSDYHRPVLHTTGMLGSLCSSSSSRRIYRTNMPELCGTRILLSKYGWLLLFRSGGIDSSELYFFNPFSRAKILLPFLDVSMLRNPVFAISAPPTSPDCMVFIISYVEPNQDYIHLCSRGDSAWNCVTAGHNGPALNVVFAKGIWYCLHALGDLVAYDPAHLCYNLLDIKDYSPGHFTFVSYPVSRGEQIFLRVHGLRCFEVPLVYYSEPLVAKEIVCQADGKLNYQDCEYLFRTDVKEAIVQEKGLVSVDSFNVDAWCAGLDADDDDAIEFRWHWFTNKRTALYRLHGTSCHYNHDCSTFVMWVEPVWVQPSPNLSWNL
ncbi:Uncharacterized protein TCM_030807 [Theobroma cacao]|uniref:F-box domain-containing protein n=1 Tax=Theobroma cacao TaxID=3641 RepID=A0A061FCP3_THECC|nr:Uncharacterized protein TCM_030807 [Theobroma cacao]